MGVKNLSDLFEESSLEIRAEAKLEDFDQKIMAMDAFNVIFQFLASIRDYSGRSLVDDDGRVTSHLVGILTRNCNLIQNGILPVYVFDGESHQLKEQIQQERRDARKVAEEEYEKALEEGDMVKARSFASRTNKLTDDMIADAKKLLQKMGIPVIQAPGEGEAQAAHMTKQGIVWATASQDYDALMFGSPIMVRNLNITGKRSKPGSNQTYTINPEIIRLKKLLDGLDITHEQLIDMGILLGSDFNPDGIYGIGPKTAYKLIKKHGSFQEIVKHDDRVKEANIPYDTIRDIFMDPNVEDITLDTSNKFDPDSIIEFLVEERGFSEGRYKNLILKTEKTIREKQEQKSLEDFF